MSDYPDIRLDAEQWTARAGEYAERVETFVAPHLKRARVGEAHPVWDFLFSYYNLRPRQLRCWHPGYGVVLAGGEAIRRYAAVAATSPTTPVSPSATFTCAAGWTPFRSWPACSRRPRGGRRS